MMNFFKKKSNIVFFAIIVVLILLRIPSLFEPIWYGDEGIYAALGQEIFHGEKLYVDTWDHKPPAIYVLYAIAKIFGTGNLFFVKLVSLLAAVGTLILLRKLARQFFNDKVALIVSGLFAFLVGTIILEGNIANAENYFMFFTTLGVYLYLNAKNNKSKMIAGLAFGAAVLFKIHPLFDFVALLFFVFVSALKNKEKIKQIVMDFLHVGIPFVLVQLLSFVITGLMIQSFQEYILTNVVYNLFYTSFTESAAEKVSFFSLQSMAFRATVTAILFLVSGALFYFKKISDRLFLFIVWFVAGLFAAFLSARAYPHYLLQVLPPFVLLCGFIAWKLMETKKVYLKVALALLPVLLLLGGFKTFFPGVTGFKDISKAVVAYNYYANFVARATGKMSQEEYSDKFDKKADDMLDLAKYIDENGKNYLDETGRVRVYLWGNSAWFYDRANVNNVSRYVVDFHIGGDPNRRIELIDDIEASVPTFIIQEKGAELFEGPVLDVDSSRSTRGLKEVIRDDYELVGVDIADRYMVYKIK